MSRIVVGKSGRNNVELDIPVLLTTRMLVTADSGGGKTFALKRICEQAAGKIQILVIDPEGEFSPLRTQYSFVLVGKGGETPADVRSAHMVAQKLLEVRASAVCDIYEMKPTERHTWVRLFLEGLIEAPKKLRHPCLVIVDEAHIFCPEHGKGESEASEAMRDLCTRGRKRMLCPLFATQRLATLNKDASSMLLNRLIGPTFEDINRKRAAEVLGITDTKKDRQAFYNEIKLLEPGYFYALGRAITKERLLVRVGPIKTPHGHEALRYETAPPPPPEKVKALLPQLSDLPKQAEAEAKTKAELKSKVRQLEAEVRAAKRAAPKPEVQRVEVPDRKGAQAAERTAREIKARYDQVRAVLEEAMRVFVKVQAFGFEDTALKPEQVEEALKAAAKEVAKVAKLRLERRDREFTLLKADANRLLAQMKRLLAKEDVRVEVAVQRNEPVTARVVAEPRSVHTLVEGDGDKRLPKGERTVLIAAAQSDTAGRDQLTVLTGYKRSSRDTYLQRLREKGYVEVNGEGVRATEAGIAALGDDYKPLPTGDELRAYWLERLPQGEKAVLEVVIRAYDQPVSREEIDEATGYKRSSRDTYLQRLGARRLVEFVDRGRVKASAELFDA